MSPTATAELLDDVVVDLGVVERVAGRWCGGLDPSTLSGRQAADGAERLAVVIRRLEAAQVRLAGRAEACNAYSARARSGVEWFATLNGSSRAEARRALETVKRLADCPVAAEAFANGDLSTEEADAVTAAAVTDPTVEQRLVDHARGHDLFETRAAADKVTRASRSAEDESARHARLHQARSWRQSETPDGNVAIQAAFVPSAFALIKPVLDACMKTRLARAHTNGERDPYEAYAADAALDALTAAGHALDLIKPTPASTEPTPTTPTIPAGLFDTTTATPLIDGLDPTIDWNIVILVDGIALKRGFAAPGETCEIPGVGRIPVSWIETLLPTAQVEMLIHDTVDIQAYATTTRHRTRPVDLAIHVRDRTCITPGCHHDITEIDHRVPYADTHDTSVANLAGLCNHDHDNKTYHHATLHRNDTHWLWWPPDTNPHTHPPRTTPIGQHLTAWNLDHRPDALPFDTDPSE